MIGAFARAIPLLSDRPKVNSFGAMLTIFAPPALAISTVRSIDPESTIIT